jgi:Lrp/AsnC family transcriptional regulator, leucine-responsive regulatory protein
MRTTAELDKLDRRILELLQENGSLSNVEVAERVHLSPSACLRRVNLLLESGLVEGNHLILDQARAGFEGTAYVYIALKGQDRKTLSAFEAAMTDVPQIQECYLVAGESDYLLRVVFRNMRDLERLHSDVITRLPGVERVQSTLTLRTVKRSTRLPLGE